MRVLPPPGIEPIRTDHDYASGQVHPFGCASPEIAGDGANPGLTDGYAERLGFKWPERVICAPRIRYSVRARSPNWITKLFPRLRVPQESLSETSRTGQEVGRPARGARSPSARLDSLHRAVWSADRTGGSLGVRLGVPRRATGAGATRFSAAATGHPRPSAAARTRPGRTSCSLQRAVAHALVLGAAVFVYFHWRMASATPAQDGAARLAGWLTVGLAVAGFYGLVHSSLLDAAAAAGATAGHWSARSSCCSCSSC